MASSSRQPKIKTVFIGNPGSGKSTILNTIFGYAKFASGVSIGEGLTHTHKTVRHDNGCLYTDTPGLADLGRLSFALGEIKKAVTSTKNVKIIFVLTLESGHFRPSDIATMSTILQAIVRSDINVAIKYGIILNKLTKSLYQHYNDSKEMFSWLDQFKNRFSGTNQILCLREETGAKDADNKMLKSKNEIMDFINCVPYITIGENLKLNETSFMDELEWMNGKEGRIQVEGSHQNSLTPTTSETFNTLTPKLENGFIVKNNKESQNSNQNSKYGKQKSALNAISKSVQNTAAKGKESIISAINKNKNKR